MALTDNLTSVVSTSWLEYIRVKCLQSVCQENRCANIDYLLKTAWNAFYYWKNVHIFFPLKM
jgi:hypothetical protein